LNVQLLTGRDRVGSQYLIIGDSVACVVAYVGAAAGCDLLIFSVLISVTKIKRSQPAAAPAQVIARAVPGKLLDNGYGIKKASSWLAFVIYGPFQGRTE